MRHEDDTMTQLLGEVKGKREGSTQFTALAQVFASQAAREAITARRHAETTDEQGDPDDAPDD